VWIYITRGSRGWYVVEVGIEGRTSWHFGAEESARQWAEVRQHEYAAQLAA
jgi:hypothetical protein